MEADRSGCQGGTPVTDAIMAEALAHLEAAEAESATIPGLPGNINLRPVDVVGIIGAGTMGGGIAMNFVNAGIRVVIVDATQDALDRGLSRVRGLYEASAAKGKLSAEAVVQRMGLLQGSLDYQALAQCDLVIEAVYEDMALKKSLCERLGLVCQPRAIIATNTSTLDVDVLADASGRPADVVGMHFFSPANVMRLLEIVRGRASAPDVLATVIALAKRIGKTPVVSGVCYGFLGNRIAEVYMRENEFLMMEGASPAEIDAAVESPSNVGMAMGPNRMLDMAGIDVGAKTVIEWRKSGGAPPDPRYRAMCRALFERGRFGQKTGTGYYRYEGRTPVSEPETESLSRELGAKHGIQRRDDIGGAEIVERLLYPMINEAAKILEEGIAYRPGDIDVVWTSGYGFPKERGGPVLMADSIGLPRIVERLQHYGRQCGNEFGYWTPSKLLVDTAERGDRLSDWRPAA